MSGHPYPHSDRDILRRLQRGGGSADYKQLVRELGMGGGRERRMLLEQLARMTARGVLVKVERERWSLPQSPGAHSRFGPHDGGTDRGGRRGFAADMRDRAQQRRASRADLIAGKLQLHRDGYGFVRASGSVNKDSDMFIPPHELNGAMQGDEVLVEPAPPSRDGRSSGRIVRVLTRRNPTVVGIFHAAGARGRRSDAKEHVVEARQADVRMRGSFVTPLDERMSQPVWIVNDRDLPATAVTPHRTLGEEAAKQEHTWDGTLEDLHGLAVDVEITHFPTENSPAQGRIVAVLGDPDAFGVDVEIVIRKHHLPHVFPANVLAEAQDAAARTVASLGDEELAGRKDFRAEPIVTIDGETAKDFDDAVLVRANADGTWHLQVHIADVAEYVRDGEALDLEARLRGNSVYFPDRAIPMLPQELSNGECSLRPDEDRMVLSCLMELDASGNVLGYEVRAGLIRSARRMTYTKVQKILDGDEALRAEYVDQVDHFERMLDLAKRLNGKRDRRGSIDFDLPEPVIEFDELGAMRGVVRAERAWANRIIEEFMLCANECVARWIESSGVPGMYRIHEIPDPKRIVDFEDTAASFGVSLGVGALPVKRLTMKTDRRENQRRAERHGGSTRKAQGHDVVGEIDVTPQMYQRLAKKIAGRPEERILSYLMLRSLKQAKYSEKNEGHFALAAEAYTHFTSPIRRYPDLIVHRIVKTLLAEGADPLGDAEPTSLGVGPRHPQVRREQFEEPYPREELQAIAQECSETERRAADAERELIEWKKIKFMQNRVGDDFDALILSVNKYGFYVELAELYVEGLVPIFTLHDDHYTYRENAREIRGGKSQRVFRPGQRVRVLLDKIDRGNRRLQFAVVEEPGAAADSSGVREWVPGRGKTAARKAKAAARGPRGPKHASPDRGGKRKKPGKGKDKGKRR